MDRRFDPEAAGFRPEDVDRARRYHRPLYVAAAVDLAMTLAALGLLAFGWPGRRLAASLGGLPWWARTLSWAAVVVSGSFLVRLPLSYWRGYVRERRWGFSTQGIGGWMADRAKGLAVGLVFGCAVLLGFVWLARTLPTGWPLAAAAAGSLLVLLLSFVAPVVLEPLFNRFHPLPDWEMAAELQRLAVRAGVPVREVLVADASRRTNKENAYVSGLGRTRRVVVYDTLLARADPAEVRLVVAHELGHRRLRHVARGTALGVGAAVGAVLALWLLLHDGALLRAAGARSAGDPRVVPLLFVAAAGLQLLAMPFESALSRRWERAADRFSLDMTGDLGVFERTHRELAIRNVADLDPPAFVYRAVFTHPTPPERIALAGRRATEPGPPTTA